MRQFFLVISLFPYLFFSQIKINDKENIRIIFPFSEIKYSIGSHYLFEIINNTDDNYIIDTDGFYRHIEIYDENDNYIQPYLFYPSSSIAERNNNECYKDYEVVLKKTKSVVLLNLFKYLGEYDLKNDKKYYIKIKNIEFGKRFSSDSGCRDYIEKMEKNGYKILEGTINLKIPLVP